MNSMLPRTLCLVFGISITYLSNALSPNPSPQTALSNVEEASLQDAFKGRLDDQRHRVDESSSIMRREAESGEGVPQIMPVAGSDSYTQPHLDGPIYIPVPVPIPAPPCPPGQDAPEVEESPDDHPDVTPYGHLHGKVPSPSYGPGGPGVGANLAPNTWAESGPTPEDLHPKALKESGKIFNASSKTSHAREKNPDLHHKYHRSSAKEEEDAREQEAKKKKKDDAEKIIEVKPEKNETEPVTTPEPVEDKEEKEQIAEVDKQAAKQVEKSEGEKELNVNVNEENKETDTMQWSQKSIAFVSIVALTSCLGFTIIGFTVGSIYYYFIAGKKDSHVVYRANVREQEISGVNVNAPIRPDDRPS